LNITWFFNTSFGVSFNVFYSDSLNTTDWKNLRIVEYNIYRNGRGGDGPNEDGLDPIVEELR